MSNVVSDLIRIGLVKPTFTAAAYNNAFYSWYALNKHDMRSQFADGGGQFSGEVYTNSNPSLAQYTVGQIPTSTSTFVTTRPSGRHSPPRFGAYSLYYYP